MAELDDGNASKDFLIAEFNALQDRAIGMEEVKSGRINFFLIIVAATVAGLSSLAGLTAFPFIVFAGAIIILMLGVSTLRSVMNYSVAIVILFRKAGRIRRWFVDSDKSIEKYIPFEANDDRPSIKIEPWLIGWRGGEPILLIINAIALSVALGLAASYLSLLWAEVGAVGVFLITWRVQVLYMSSHLNRYELLENQKSIFPTIESKPRKKSSRKNAT